MAVRASVRSGSTAMSQPNPAILLDEESLGPPADATDAAGPEGDVSVGDSEPASGERAPRGALSDQEPTPAGMDGDVDLGDEESTPKKVAILTATLDDPIGAHDVP